MAEKMNDKPKLAKWVNPPKVSDLQSDYNEARGFHSDQSAKVADWKSYLEGKGKFKPDATNKTRSQVTPKLIRKQAEWRYPSLSEPFLSTNDLFNISPVTAADREAARQNQLVLNYQFNNKINKVRFIDEYIRAAVDEGTVICRVGWDYEEETIEVPQYSYEMKESNDPKVMVMHQRIHQLMMVQSPNLDGVSQQWIQAHQQYMQTGIPVEPVEIELDETIEEIRVTKNQPTLQVCEFDRVVIDPTCEGDLSKAQFIIYEFETSLSDLQKEGKYTNLDKIFTEKEDGATILSQPDDKAPAFTFKDKARKKLTAYEYWGYWAIDGEDEPTKPFVATYVGNTMIRLEENPFPDGKLPFIMTHYLPVRKSVYGEPDVELLKDNQDIIGAVTRGMIDIMGKSANAQVGISKDALDVVNYRKFKNGEDYFFNPTTHPDRAFHMGTYPEIPRSAMDMISMQNADAESMSGVKAFSTGISGQALGSVATGVRGALDAASKRELAILRRLSNGIIEIGKKIISMNQEFLSDTEIVRITDDEIIEIKREDLAGEFDLSLSISTAEADNEKAQELAFMLQTVGPNEDPMVRKMIMADIARLRKMPDLAKKLEEYQPQPDPVAVERAQLEIELLRAQIANEQAKGQENAIDVQLKAAKTQNELAKAGKTTSEKDLKDAEFIDKVTGAEHNRKMQEKDFDRQVKLDEKAFDALNSTKGESNGL